jgi:hypothetical protein
MPPDRSRIAARSLPDRTAIAGRSQANATTNTPLSRWSGRSTTGRRCRDLFRSYLKQLGSPTDPATQAAIMALAEQVVIAESARSECLAAGGLTKISLELVIRAENLANRTLKRLKLDKPATAPRKTFMEKMIEREAAQKAAEAKAAATSDPCSDEAGAQADVGAA